MGWRSLKNQKHHLPFFKHPIPPLFFLHIWNSGVFLLVSSTIVFWLLSGPPSLTHFHRFLFVVNCYGASFTIQWLQVQRTMERWKVIPFACRRIGAVKMGGLIRTIQKRNVIWLHGQLQKQVDYNIIVIIDSVLKNGNDVLTSSTFCYWS